MSLIKEELIKNFIKEITDTEEISYEYPSEEDKYRIWGVTSIRDVLWYNDPNDISIETINFLANLYGEIIEPFEGYNKKDFERDYDSISSLGFSLFPNTKYWKDKHPNCDKRK